MSSPKHDLRDVAARFARKARSDEVALEKLSGDHDVPDDVIGFHTQQAVEKLLKAYLAHRASPDETFLTFARRHDGESLRKLADAEVSS